MKVDDVCATVQKAGFDKKQNAEINATLDRMAKGKFSFTEKFEMGVAGVKGSDMQALAQGAKQIVDNDFRGDARAALAFMKDVQHTGIGKLDFTQIVASGTAHRLIELQKSNPDGFKHLCGGQYPDLASLNRAMGGGTPTTGPAATGSRYQSGQRALTS